MAKKKETETEFKESGISFLTTPMSNGELEVVRQKLNEVIEKLNG